MALENNVDKKEKVSKSENSFLGFLGEFKGELKRITWPSKEEAKKATMTVITFCLMYIVFVGLLDLGFNNIYKLIFK